MINDSYIAGLFDGEGSVGIYVVGNNNKNNKTFWSIKIAIVGTYKPMIEAIYQYLDIGKFTTQKRQSTISVKDKKYNMNDINCKQGWIWFITSKEEALIFLNRITPLLYEKKEQCEIVLKWLNNEIDAESASLICKKLKKFNFPNDLVNEERRVYNFKGENNPCSRLTNEKAQEIREFVASGNKQSDAVKKFGVSKSIINRLILGKTYNSVNEYNTV